MVSELVRLLVTIRSRVSWMELPSFNFDVARALIDEVDNSEIEQLLRQANATSSAQLKIIRVEKDRIHTTSLPATGTPICWWRSTSMVGWRGWKCKEQTTVYAKRRVYFRSFYKFKEVFQDDSSFAGSTLEVLGLIRPKPTRGQWSIVGGTGAFTNAHGTIKYTDVQSTVSSITDNVRELDIHIFYAPETSGERCLEPNRADGMHKVASEAAAGKHHARPNPSGFGYPQVALGWAGGVAV
ncbi:benzothiadiazole-induced protein-like [Panicum miliaceum]|uniref:Dirigent protein n=1 Tax=Panicum miliaceum TaxID=4540 RepID=A0A3L6TRV7_PANMI|nr:benzothiadiazole-induced protein-like [Panicum miliaceum]